LVGGLVDTAHGQAASQIKGLEADYLAHKLAHALAGCVAGAAAGGACKDGAIGGAVGEIVAEMFTKPGTAATKAEIDAFNTKVLAYSKLVAGAVSAYAGGNAQTAITTAETAVRTNYLTDAQKIKKDKELASCTTLVCAANVVAKYGGISGAQDAALLMGIGQGIGYQTLDQAVAMVDMLKNPSATFAALNALVNDADFRTRAGAQLADDYKQRIATMLKSYNEGGFNGANAAGIEFGRLAVDIVGTATATVGAAKVAVTVTKVASAVVADAFVMTSETVARGLLKFDYLTANGGLFGLDGKPLMDFSKLSTTQKGMIGELLGGQSFMSIAPDGTKLARAAAVGQTGIDDIFKVSRPGVDYVVIEYKFGTSTLKNTADGLQMSDTWLSGSTTGTNRILDAVGNLDTARSIDAAIKAGRVEKWLVNTDQFGNVTFGMLDKNGKLVPNPQLTSQILGRAK
jgi:large exoprotein involved in heme utilization and adhesion